jgi:uncharacterized hydantoinase/oxoprolinase family protein
LRNISEPDYTVETADGKEKTRAAALTRLARVVCADTETLTEAEIVQMARQVYDAQLGQIAEALTQVRNRLNTGGIVSAAVVTGLGRNFLARKAAEEAGFEEVVDFGELVGGDVAKVSTAFAVALMGASFIEGGIVRWMQ